MGMQISVLNLGRMEFPEYLLVANDDESVMVKSPSAAILIKHPELGNILYDTGNSSNYEAEYTQEMKDDYPITRLISIEKALEEKGMTPSDIDVLIISHLHFDHAGGMRQFVGTKAIQNVIVAEDDLKNAYYCTVTGNGGAYIKSLFDVEGVCFKPISDSVKLADDIELFIQKSHTPGVIGMILKTKTEGEVIFTSDALYTSASFERQLPPGGHINKTQEEFYTNLERIKKMKEERNATLFYGHDYAQVMEWSERGWFE